MSFSSPTRNIIFEQVDREIERSNKLHGEQLDLPDAIWALIAGEEAGEAIKAALQAKSFEGLYEEVIQSAAMFIKWAQALQYKGLTDWRKGWEAGHKAS